MKKIDYKITIIVDTREKKNAHILSALDKAEIEHIPSALKFGDYSAIVTFTDGKQIDLRNMIAIERKATLTELAGNFTVGRDRFKQEFQRAQMQEAKMFLLIENSNYYRDILRGEYRTGLRPAAFLGSLMSFIYRYNINILSTERELAGSKIYRTLDAYVKYNLNELKYKAEV